jgi:Rrf2 family nitric oxide-sensitive transcriptional repressor
VRAVEPDFALVECFGKDNRCALTAYCRLAGVLGTAMGSFLAHLDSCTLGDLVPDVAQPSPSPVTLQRRPQAPSISRVGDHRPHRA